MQMTRGTRTTGRWAWKGTSVKAPRRVILCSYLGVDEMEVRPSMPCCLRKRRSLAGGGFMAPPVSPSAMDLVEALVDVAQQLSRYPNLKPCQMRNARVATRRMKLLSFLFEEIRETQIRLPSSALLCFRELHSVLQRTLYLLDDLRHGSCVWSLMRAESISHQFQQLTQDMATALDVLPLGLMALSDEVREHLRLAHRQASRATPFIHPSLQRLRNDVLTVLHQFENKVTPDASKLRTIFDDLHLRDARSCLTEIRLLEDEMRYLATFDGEGTIAMINSLISFVRYCKCVLFGVADVEEEGLGSSKAAQNSANDVLALPDDFRCPISLDLMRDPVIVATGQTYDRVCITRWIEEGHSTCPKSGQKLVHTNLIPNNALRNLISQWCEEHGIPFERTQKSTGNGRLEGMSSTKAALEATRMTAAFLVEKLSTGSPEVKKQVAYDLRLLAKCGMDNRACIGEAGAIPWLVALLSSRDPKSQENAVTALLNLSIYECNKAKIVESGALEPIVQVLKGGLTMEARENAAATLFSLSVTDEYRKMIGERTEAMAALVDLLGKGTARGIKDAATAMFNLSLDRSNANRAVSAGAVPLLVNLLTDEMPGITDDALAVLAVLAGQVQGSMEILKTCAIPVLVSLLGSSFSSSPKGKENSMVVLLGLCLHGGDEIVNQVVGIPSLVPSLYSLITTGTPRARRKARSLFKVFQRRGAATTITNTVSR